MALEIDSNGARLRERTSAGMIFVDGVDIGNPDDVALRDRRTHSADGVFIVVVTVSAEDGSSVAEPELIFRGVPFLDDAADELLDELRAEVERLAESARAGSLKPEELRGSTFTVTSAGKLGGLLTTPIVNYPEVGILSIGRVGERPVVREGQVVARPTGTIAVTFDHRVVDGARAAEFGLAVIRRLESAGPQAPPGA